MRHVLNQGIITVSTATAASESTARRFDAAGEDEVGYTAWLRAKVQRALDDTRPRIAHAEAMARIRRSIEEIAQQKAQGGT